MASCHFPVTTAHSGGVGAGAAMPVPRDARGTVPRAKAQPSPGILTCLRGHYVCLSLPGATGEQLSACPESPESSSQGRGPRTSPWVSPASWQRKVITLALIVGKV